MFYTCDSNAVASFLTVWSSSGDWIATRAKGFFGIGAPPVEWTGPNLQADIDAGIIRHATATDLAVLRSLDEAVRDHAMAEEILKRRCPMGGHGFAWAKRIVRARGK